MINVHVNLKIYEVETRPHNNILCLIEGIEQFMLSIEFVMIANQ